MDPLNTTNPAPAPNPQMNPGIPPQEPRRGGFNGAVIAVVVILAVVIVGALYFWLERKDEPGIQGDDATIGEKAMLQSINTQSQVDVIETIEADLNNTPVDTLDKELNTAE